MTIRPIPTHTYTVAEMPVPPQVYDHIRDYLRSNGYGHCIDEATGLIDMHGIALSRDGEPAATIRVFVQDGKATHPASSGPRLPDGFHLFRHVSPVLTFEDRT